MSSKEEDNIANTGQLNNSNTNLSGGKSPQQQLQQNVHEDISKILGSSGNKPIPAANSSSPPIQDQKQTSQQKPSQPQSQQQRLISSASSGTLNAPQSRPQGQMGLQPSQQQQQPSQPVSRLSKYTRVRIIGRGAYGIVSLVKNLSGQYLAMKEVNQVKLRKDSKAHQAYMEKIVCSFSHPGIPQFHSCFRQGDKLYFIMAYVEGELLSMLIKKHIDLLTEPIIQFYIAEIVLTLEYIHSLGFSHRDIKAENLVITKEGHIQLIDYGTLNDYCTQLIPPEALENVKAKDAHRRDRITAKKKSEIAKIFEEEERQSNPRDADGSSENRGISKKIKDIKLNSEDQEDIERRIRCQTFCGTAEYLCPEMLEDQSCEMSGDLWALGCLIYKLFTNVTPFIDESQLLIFQRIKQGNYNKQHEKIPPNAQALIDALLVLDSHSRLGSVIVDQHTTAKTVHEAYSKLKAHPFFHGIKWESLYSSSPPQCVIDLLNTIRNPVFKANEPKDMNDFCDNSDDDDDDDDFEDGFRNDQGYKDIQQKKNFEPANNITSNTSSKSQQSQKQPESPSKLALLRQSEGASNALSKTQSTPQTTDAYQNNIQSHRKHTSETSQRQLTYIQMVNSFDKPFTLENLFYQTQIIKVNKHLLLFSTKRPRQILLFDVDPITMIYYIPTKPNPTIKRVVLDNSVQIILESQKKIVFQDNAEKYIFEDSKGNSPALLYDAIERLKKKRANK